VIEMLESMTLRKINIVRVLTQYGWTVETLDKTPVGPIAQRTENTPLLITALKDEYFISIIGGEQLGTSSKMSEDGVYNKVEVKMNNSLKQERIERFSSLEELEKALEKPREFIYELL